jgi:tRNA (mo5U34)-methyltransferase
VPFWFHRFALNRAGGIFAPGAARDRRARVSALPEDFAGMSVLDVGCFDGVYAVLAERRGGPRRSWRWTTSSIGCGSFPVAR